MIIPSGRAGQGKATHGKVIYLWHGKVWLGEARRGKVGLGRAGLFIYGMARRGLAVHGKASRG